MDALGIITNPFFLVEATKNSKPRNTNKHTKNTLTHTHTSTAQTIQHKQTQTHINKKHWLFVCI